MTKLLDQPAHVDDRTSAYFFHIDHPMAAKAGVLYPKDLRIVDGQPECDVHYDAPLLECAFFATNGDFVVETVEGFDEYSDFMDAILGREPDMRTYHDIPRQVLEQFLAAHNGYLLTSRLRGGIE